MYVLVCACVYLRMYINAMHHEPQIILIPIYKRWGADSMQIFLYNKRMSIYVSYSISWSNISLNLHILFRFKHTV